MAQEFDIEEFARMFDAALASDKPAVKKALRNFMMVAAIVHAEEDGDERIMGPLETLVKKVSDVERQLHDMKAVQTYKRYKDDYKPRPGDYFRDYYYGNDTSTTSDTTWKDSAGYTAQELSELMKDYKFK